MDSSRGLSDEEYSYIGDKGDIGFLDPEDCKSLCSYKPSEESEVVNISVPFPLSHGKPQSGIVGETMFDSITIKNTSSESLQLWSVKIYDAKPENSFTLSILKPPAPADDVEYVRAFMESATLEDRMVGTGQSLTVWLSCKPKEIGLHTAAIHFSVEDETIERIVVLLAEDKISRSLSSSKPYQRSTRRRQNIVNVHSENAKYVVGRRPSRSSNRGAKNRLLDYRIPDDVREMLNRREVPSTVDEGLNMKNYGLFFKNLLAMEEIKMEEDMRAYDMECVKMKRAKRDQLLSLEVPGLAEKRPSLVIGDNIFVKLATEDETLPANQGFIHRVEAEEIFLKFDSKFHNGHREENLYNVQFTYNRMQMRRLYQAVEAAEQLDRNFLFPCSSFGRRQVKPKKLVPISCTLNENQVRAVEMILACTGGPPYLIHGPPGTGKTMTLIEAMLQIYFAKRNARMLICAPSNSAADHILERLVSQESVQINKDEVFRLNAQTRPYEDVDPDLIEFCYVEDYIFCCPSVKELEKYRIIISTYTSASRLYAEGVKRGHFSYVFLDEAGQASEPETMVPISNLYTRNSVVVLAGDPMQLGPVIFSRDAERYGLGMSYLERLFDCELYCNGDENFMTKLVRNYRTHEAILRLPSELFYSGELIPCKEVKSFSGSWEDVFPNKEFPLLFVGIQGCDEREGSNPSWFNRTEASKVVEMIRILLEEKKLTEDDIGVITPYRQQVNKIRGALGCFGGPNIKVGSVEQFQGQEREVIIISTVRSTAKHNEFDRVHYLGFLSNPKRFNVAITRAKSLLIVIGNPHIICKDPNWSKLLWYCDDSGSYKGCFLPAREEFSAKEFAQNEHTNAQYTNNDFQPAEGDGWQPTEDQWGGNWDDRGDGWQQQASENQWGNDWDQQPSEKKWDNDWDQQPSEKKRDNDWDQQPSEDQQALEEHTNQEATSAPLGNNQDDRFQPSDVPWE